MNVPYGLGYDYSEDDVIQVARRYQIPIYIIGIGSDVDYGVLERIASQTGGKFYSNQTASSLYNIYEEIYSLQKDMYELSYKSEQKNSMSRKVYMYYYDKNTAVGFRTQFTLEPAEILDGYSVVSVDDITSYFTKKKYLSSDDLAQLSVDDIQTIINIYSAKYGYKFTKPAVLNQMKSLGVISKNGSKNMGSVDAAMKKNSVVYANFKALQNARYEKIFVETERVYNSYGYIDLTDLQEEVNSNLNADKGRFNLDIKKAYDALTYYY